MKVFLTGATGAIGSHAVPALIGAGHQVTALARTPEKADRLRCHGAVPVLVSLFDTAALTSAFAGHDAVINLATSVPSSLAYPFTRSWRENDRIRTVGTEAVVNAAIAADVPRIVQESIGFIFRDGGDHWLDEQAETELFPIAIPTAASEGHIARFTAAGGDGVILRFGLLYGPGSVQSRELLTAARLRLGVRLGPRNGYCSPVHLEDAATAAVAALTAPPGIYNVVDDEPLTKADFGRAISTAVGRRAWLSGPGRLTRLGGSNTAALTRSQRLTNARFRAVTGWTPRYPNARAGWIATAANLRAGHPAGRLGLALAAVIVLVVALRLIS